jgi:hypothetical protein
LALVAAGAAAAAGWAGSAGIQLDVEKDDGKEGKG